MAEPAITLRNGTVRFGLLGALQVTDATGASRPVRAAKQRIFLATLLLSAGATVSARKMAEALWDSPAPPNAPAVMRTYAMRLRRCLGPVGVRISSHVPGWTIALNGPCELDLTYVEQLGRVAGAAGRKADWQQASALLTEALAQWRGEPLIDVPSAAIQQREAARLSELRLQLTEARIDADLNLGRHLALIAELRRLVAEHPLREQFRVQMMLACYRSGQQAAALDAYRDAHRALASELGIAPGPGLRDMHQRVLANDPGLNRIADQIAAGGQPSSRRRSGAQSRPASGGGGYRHGLPPDLRAFTGRERHLALIMGAVARAGAGWPVRVGRSAGDETIRGVRIQTISGMPGVGKTALAVRAAHRLAEAFPDRQLFIDLHAYTQGRDAVSPAAALAELLVAVGVDAESLPADLPSRSAMWRDKIASQRVLLVLDNAASSAQVTPLVPGSGDCLVLVTSRRQLADLPILAASVGLGPLAAAEARSMFTRLVPRAREEEPRLVDELTGLTGYLPLGISMLARVYARHPSWTLADLIGETRGNLLTLSAEHASIAATLKVSWAHLDAGPRRMLAILGLYPESSIEPATAAAMADLPVEEAIWQLDELHRECLLTETGYRRYEIHDLIHAFAVAQARDLLSETEAAAARAAMVMGARSLAGRGRDALKIRRRYRANGGWNVAVTPGPTLAGGTSLACQ